MPAVAMEGTTASDRLRSEASLVKGDSLGTGQKEVRMTAKAKNRRQLADEIVHDGRGSWESRCHAGFYPQARFSGSFSGDVPPYVFGVHMKPPFTRRFTHAPRFPCFAIKRTRPLRDAVSLLTYA
jgi:hypothetical protein